MEQVTPKAQMLKRQQQLAANRERVWRYHLKHNPPALQPEPKKPPTSNTRRSQNFHARQNLQTNSIYSPIFEPPTRREPKKFPFKEGTRAYSQRLQNQPMQPKRIPFRNQEQAQRFYAKKQQMCLKCAIQIREIHQMSPSSANMKEVCDPIQIRRNS